MVMLAPHAGVDKFPTAQISAGQSLLDKCLPSAVV